MLLLLTGLPGSGKTTLARAYAQQFGALHLNSDIIRGQLDLRGHYSTEDKQKVYDSLLEQTRIALGANKDVVIDSTFYQNAIREPFIQLAKSIQTPIHWVETQASEQTIRQRTSQPRPDSEADFSVYQQIRDQYEPLTEPHLTLQTDTDSPERLAERIHQYLTRHDH
jgi:predicted kinase